MEVEKSEPKVLNEFQHKHLNEQLTQLMALLENDWPQAAAILALLIEEYQSSEYQQALVSLSEKMAGFDSDGVVAMSIVNTRDIVIETINLNQAGKPMNNKQKVLIVDDVAENINFLMNILKEHYSIIAATNGAKALERARKSPQPDIILLDIMMPDMDGYEVCTRLKDDGVTAGIPVIFVTALGEIADETKGLQLGAVDYLTKPVIPELVKSRVFNQLELKRYRDHLKELVDERTRQLKKSKEATIEAMGIVAEGRDPETGGHIQRTKEYVRLLAEALARWEKYKNILTAEYIELILSLRAAS